MVLQKIVHKSSNLIIQQLQKGSTSSSIAVVVGSGHSVSVDDRNNVTFTDPGFRPPKKIASYGTDCTLFTIYYPKTCEGLDVAGKELAEFINENLNFYRKIILHGHSKCGCCFVNLAQWLDGWSLLRTHIITVSAPFKGTPVADIQGFSKKLNAIEKFFYRKIFSDHKVDRDICPDSGFISNLNWHNINKLHIEHVVSKCAPSLNPKD